MDNVVNCSAPTRRLVGLDNAGHLFPTDLCWMSNTGGQNIVQEAHPEVTEFLQDLAP